MLHAAHNGGPAILWPTGVQRSSEMQGTNGLRSGQFQSLQQRFVDRFQARRADVFVEVLYCVSPSIDGTLL
jgi:hypothetical protein